MHPKSTRSVVSLSLLAFAIGPAFAAVEAQHAPVDSTVRMAAAATSQEPAESKKRQKKRVKATLAEPASRPAEAPAEAAEGTPEAAGEATVEDAPSQGTPAPDAPGQGASARDAAAGAATVTDAPADVPILAERVEVIEVLLDAIVEDGGRVVTGLGAEDFVVEEKGRPVEVTSATFYGTPEQLEATGEGDVERADRYFIFLFHDRSRDATFLRPILLDAGQQARRWVEQERLPNDQVAVLMYDVRLKVYTDFTRDPEQMTEAITRAVSAKKAPERQAGRSKEPLRPTSDSPSLLLNLPGGPDLARDSRIFEKALALLGRAAEGIVGRKNLMLFSVGFGEVASNGVWTPDTRYYPALERNLNDGNVAVYSIDLLGSRRVGLAGPGIASSLSSIADDTAGLYFDAFTSFMTPMKAVADDTTGYYLLSYRSEYPRGTSGYREVKVETRERGYDVRARRGYMFGAERQPLPPDPDVLDEDGEASSRPRSTGS